MPFKEIARIEGISENSAKVNYHRVIIRLGYLAATATVVAVLFVHRSAEHAAQPPRHSVPQVATLDPATVRALRDLMPALVPADDYVLHVPVDDETMRLAVPLGYLVGVSAPPELPRAANLSAAELERLGDLIGDAR